MHPMLAIRYLEGSFYTLLENMTSPKMIAYSITIYVGARIYVECAFGILSTKPGW
jgi:hypothetical protein